MWRQIVSCKWLSCFWLESRSVRGFEDLSGWVRHGIGISVLVDMEECIWFVAFGKFADDNVSAQFVSPDY